MFLPVGFGTVFHGSPATVRHLCWAGGTESLPYTEQSGDRGSTGRNETNYKINKTKNVSCVLSSEETSMAFIWSSDNYQPLY